MLTRKKSGLVLPPRKEDGKMKRVKLLRNVIVNGTACEAGDVVETSAHIAEYLIAIGKAEEVAAGAKKRRATSKRASKRESR